MLMLVFCSSNRYEPSTMYLLRLLFWFFIGWLIYRFIRQSLPPNVPPAKDNTRQHHTGQSSESIQKMVRCQVCDLYVPQTEAIEAHGRYYCCEDHRRRDQQNR